MKEFFRGSRLIIIAVIIQTLLLASILTTDPIKQSDVILIGAMALINGLVLFFNTNLLERSYERESGLINMLDESYKRTSKIIKEWGECQIQIVDLLEAIEKGERDAFQQRTEESNSKPH